MKKIISLIITICFIVSSFNNVIFASTGYNTNYNKTNTFEETLLPKSLGSITYSDIKNSNNIVINIQDLHTNAQVQKNIDKILNYLSDKNKIRAIYLEGASDKVNTSWLKDLPDEEKTTISNTLINIGLLTGTEYFTINSNKNIPLYGLEDKKIHQENIDNLSILINNANFIEKILLSIKKDLNILNNRFVNKENKKFAKAINEYKSKKISTLEFYSILISYINDISKNNDKYNNLVNLTEKDYPNILFLKDILSLEQQINKKDLYTEFKVILLEIKKNLSADQYKNFLSVTNNATNIKELTYFIKQFSINNNLNLSQRYPNIALLIKSNSITENINFTKILKEEEKLISNIKNALSYNLLEYEITFLNDFYVYLEKALTNGLTAKDYDYFINSIDKFESLYPKYVVYNQLKDIKKYIEISKQFYKINNSRNDIFVEKIKKDITSNSNEKNIIVLVTGGYHTEGLNKILSQQNISFITITPQIANIPNNLNLYNTIITQESKDYSKNTMAFTIASQMEGTTFAKTLIVAGLQNKVPFQQIKQIAKTVFNNRVIHEDDNSFTLAIGIEPVTITQQNGYAVLDSDIDITIDENLSKELSVLAQDIDSKDDKLSIKLLLNLLNILNHYQSFDNFALTKENDILKAIINTLVFMVEELNIQFSNGFEQEYIEEYVNDEIINNPSRQDKTLDGVDINTARFLPKVIQSILYENDKSKNKIDIRKQQFDEGVDTSDETEYLQNYHKSSLQISGLIASIMKDVFDFIESDEKISPELKVFFYNLANISDIANYITVAVFNLAENVKGISLAQGLIGLTISLKYPMLIECMGHEFAHEMLLRLKDYIDPNNNSILNKLFAHEAHSYLFSVLFAQIFNNLLSTSFSDTEYRDYSKFLIDLNDLYSSSIRRNLTDKTKSIAQAKEIHIPVLNFINMLNRCLGKDGNLMSLQDLMTLTETVREVFLRDNYAEMPYPTILYTILIEFAKKLNPNSKSILNKYSNQIIIATKLFTINEPDSNSLLIETFANVLLKGTPQQIESFINDKFISPQKDIQQYKDLIKKLYSPVTLTVSPELYDIVDEIFFTILGNRILSLKNTILSRETKILVGSIINEIEAFNEYCDTTSIKDKKTAFEKLLKILKEQNNIESLTDDDLSNLFIQAFSSIYAETSNGRFSISQADSTDTYEAINEVLPTILQKHNKVINLSAVINLIIIPSKYQSIDITKEMLKIKNIDLEDTLEILTELFITLVKDKNISFNADIINTEIKDYAKDKESVAGLPIDVFSKLPTFIQEILFNAETTIIENQNEFILELYIQNKNKTNALLKFVLHDIYTLLKNQGYDKLLSIPNTESLTIFVGDVPSGVSSGKFIAINPIDESFLNVIAHELGHILFTNEGFSPLKSIPTHELYAYTLGLLTTTIYNDKDIETQKFLPVTYENLTDGDEHSLPKTLLQLIIDTKGSPLDEYQLLSILKACKTILNENVSDITNIELAYRILEQLEQDENFMQGFMPNALTIKLETVLDEPLERKNKILEQLFNVTLPDSILIVDKETFIRNTEKGPIFINRKVINEIFDKDGNIIEGKEQDFYYLKELVRLQVLQQFDSTKQERADDFEKLYQYFKELENMIKVGPFSKYSVTFKKEVNRMILQNGKELIYINPEYLKKIDSSKYFDYLIGLVMLRSLEKKFNEKFNTNAKFDFYANIDNLDNIPIDLQKFSNTMNTYEYLKQEYDKYHSKQQKIKQAIDNVLTENKVKDKQLFADRIKNLMLIVENPNIDFVSIEFFRELFSELDSKTIQQIYDNLIEVYSYLIKNNLLSFNSSFSKEIEDYIIYAKLNNLDEVKINIAKQMPSFIQKMLYKNVILKENFKTARDFAKLIKYDKNRTNALLNIISEDITNILAEIYPDINKEILSTQLFFASLERITYGTNYTNKRISISNKLIKRFKSEPEILINTILKSIAHELGHEELILREVLPNRGMVKSLHELYAYLFEILFVRSYTKLKGIKEEKFKTEPRKNFISDTIDLIIMKKELLINYILGKKEEHIQAQKLLDVISNKQYQELFTKERIIEILDFIETLSNGISFEDDNITKIINVDELNIQAISFFILMLMFGTIDIPFQKILSLSKALTIFDTELFDSNKVLEALARNDTDYMYNLIDEIIAKGNARIKELNEILFGDKTFVLNDKTYGYSITTNRSENGLLKDDKILIYFAPNEIKFLADNMSSKKAETIKRNANLLTKIISKDPRLFVLPQQISIVTNRDKRIKTIRGTIIAPIKRMLLITDFLLDRMGIVEKILMPSPFKNIESMNVIYYDNLDIIIPNKNVLSVYIAETDIDFYKTSFELTEYTINGRSLRVSYDKKNNFMIAYCPQASKQEIIEITAKYIKETTSQENNITLKNIVVDSTVLPDTITYHLSQDNEGFACISATFMKLGFTFIEDLLKLDDIESVMFAKQIYDYIGDIPFKQLSKILQDKTLGDNQIIIDSDVLLRELLANRILLKTLLKTSQLKVIVKVSSQQEMEKFYDAYEITNFMLETQKDNVISREIVEYTPSEGITQKAPVSYIELTDLTNIEDRLENIPSHQAIVISVNADSAKDINISDNMILSSLKTTITKILKTKAISTKTASNMGKELAKQINISDEEKEKLANNYNKIKNSLTTDNLTKFINDFPNVFPSEIVSYMEKLFDHDTEEITPVLAAFVDKFLNDILYDDEDFGNIEATIQLDNIKYYKNLLSAA